MRIILFTGKGGTGKTTTAAATALEAASRGYKTLVISTDPAHSLSDALDIELGPEPVNITENLDGQEFDIYYSMKKYWGNMRQLMKTIITWQGVRDVVAEEMSVLPGMEQASAFLWLEQHYTENKYDLLVIDSAPTGETLSLLTLPESTKSWMNRAFPLMKTAIKSFMAILRRITKVPVDQGYEEFEQMFRKLDRIHQAFTDPSITSIRIVTNPEKMVISEAKRSYTHLQMYGYNVDAVVVNRILPEVSGNGLFKQYREDQKRYLEEIEESFNPLPIFRVNHLGHEAFGIDLMRQIGKEMYRDEDPARIYFQEKPMEIQDLEDRYEVRLKVPFLDSGKFTLNKFGDEIVLEVNSRRKRLYLPRFANFLELSGYRREDSWLVVELKKK